MPRGVRIADGDKQTSERNAYALHDAGARPLTRYARVRQAFLWSARVSRAGLGILQTNSSLLAVGYCL